MIEVSSKCFENLEFWLTFKNSFKYGHQDNAMLVFKRYSLELMTSLIIL